MGLIMLNMTQQNCMITAIILRLELTIKTRQASTQDRHTPRVGVPIQLAKRRLTLGEGITQMRLVLRQNMNGKRLRGHEGVIAA